MGRHWGQSMPAVSEAEVLLVTSDATHLAGPPLPEHTNSMARCCTEGDAAAMSSAAMKAANTHRRSDRCWQAVNMGR